MKGKWFIIAVAVLLIGFTAYLTSTKGPIQASPTPNINMSFIPIVDSLLIPTLMESAGEFVKFRNGHPSSYFDPEKDTVIYLYSDVRVPKLKFDSSRTPLNLALVLDMSGSMQGMKFQNVLQAAEQLINKLGPQDILSIIAYSSEVEVLFESQPVENKEVLIQMLRELNADGLTNLSGGLRAGFDQVFTQAGSEYLNRVLLFSDGLANRGVIDPQEILQLASESYEKTGVGLSTFGVGLDYNEDLMQSLSENGGNYYFIEKSGDIKGILVKELNGLLEVGAKDLQLSITYPSVLKLDRVYGYEYKAIGKNKIRVDLGHGYSEEKKSLVFRFILPKGVRDKLKFEEYLHYVKADDNSVVELHEFTQMEYSTDSSLFLSHLDSLVLDQVMLFEKNELWSSSMLYFEEHGTLDFLAFDTLYFRDKIGIASFSAENKLQDSLIKSYKYSIQNSNGSDQDMKSIQKENKAYNYSIRKKRK